MPPFRPASFEPEPIVGIGTTWNDTITATGTGTFTTNFAISPTVLRTIRNMQAQSATPNDGVAILPSYVDRKEKKEMTEEQRFIHKIQAIMADGGVPSKEDMKRYLSLIKKKRHIQRSERTAFHDPQNDVGKDMESVVLDDIVAMV